MILREDSRPRGNLGGQLDVEKGNLTRHSDGKALTRKREREGNGDGEHGGGHKLRRKRGDGLTRTDDGGTSEWKTTL